uniref:NEDD8-activating enzyme E1 catalytic subunit n=1 Tax=Oryzias latipes TaxID=8090 RepID=A0A3P9HJD2_ORYLA
VLLSSFREKKRRRKEDLTDKMAVDGGHRTSGCSWEGRWNHVRKFLERPGPFTHPDFEPSPEFCEIVLVSWDVSFRPNDVGRPKAEVAAEFINSRIPGCKVLPHFKKIQDFDDSFYRQFHIIVCGLDSIIARRWMNGMLISILSYDEGVLDPSSIIPLIDGGTEGFKGNARVILPGMTACIDCTLELYPPQINFPMCTIASMPRLPEHCIEYVRILQWPKETPFGGSLDGDNPEHIQWVFERAQERAAEFSIPGVTYRLTQAACATEVFKIATSAYIPLNNYLVFNDVDGLYTHAFEAERKENCTACSQVPQDLQFPPSAKLQEILEYLTENSSLQMKSPAITTVLEGKNKTLYLQSVKSIEERTRPNLCKTLKELGLSDGQELAVADVTTPQTVLFKLNFTA